MQTTESQFFGEQNEVKLYTSLIQEFQKSTGPLNVKQQNRLGKALEHYMREVWDTNGPMPLGNLNREVFGATANDFNGYLRRERATPSSAREAEVLVSDTRNQPVMDGARLALQARPTFETGLLQDTGVRFEQLQQSRNNAGSTPPPPPDFQIALSSSGDEPSSLSLYESAKKSREAEAARVTAQVADTKTDAKPLVRFMSPSSVQNDANFNPTLALPTVQATRGPLQQDFIIKQDDIISYKETEYNLFLYSADRDWLNNKTENRYNFSVTFDPANNQQGFNLNSSVNKRFKNITRIELIKAIVPTEGLDTLVTSANSGSKLNALSFPYVLLRIPELDTNNFGTDNNFDNSFGVLQYDANWYTDNVNLTDGYLAMIPKFMKCQKVYHPTPLATLNKLTIQLQRPDGSQLSKVADSLSIRGVYIGGSLPYSVTTGAPLYKSNSGYLFIQTTAYFSQWTFAVGNRIQIQGLNASQMGGSAAATDLVNYLQSNNSTSTQNDLLIVAVANTTVAAPSSATLVDGVNSVGYANVIIVRCPYNDPSTGATSVNFFGGAASNTTLGTALGTSALTSGALINLTHQTSIVLRVITRELDSTARIRPDNL
jgi:hypothetical protein